MLEQNTRVSEFLQIKDTTKINVPSFSLKNFTQDENDADNDTQGPNYYEMFQRSILDQSKDYPSPVAVITLFQNGEFMPFLTLKSFSLWQGKQKSKKTTVLAIAIAAFISKYISDADTRFDEAMDGVVLFFDNEQGESYAARTKKLILKIAGVQTSDRLIYCDLREFSPTERIKIIETAVENTPNVRLVVVDGLVDLLNDFMDASEGHLTITQMLKLCSKFNIHVAGVLHQNKNDKNARAHVGSIASQKCEVEITTDVDPKDRAQSIVSCLNSRGLPFEPFAIRWDKGCMPCINQDWNELKETSARANKTYEKAKEYAEAIFQPPTSLSYKQAIKAMTSVLLKSESTIKRTINDWLAWDLIVKNDEGLYRLFTI